MFQNLKLLICLATFGIVTLAVSAKDLPKYQISQIPAELIENANSVVRNQELNVVIVSQSKFTTKRIYAITILNESALNDSRLNIAYGKFNRISGIEVNVYNASGERVKRIKQEDILDLSAINIGTIYSDYRRKYIDPKYQTYPFTVEYQYTETYSSLFFLRSWTVFMGNNTSVEKSQITIEYPEEYNLRFKENKISQQKATTSSPGKKTIQWAVSNFKAQNPEPYSPDYDQMYPCVFIAPSTFEIDDYSGNMQSWQDFGKFITILNEKQNNLPEETKDRIKSLVKNCTDDYEKVKLIYEYSQNKNRYISIQVGIGGWKSIDAETVDRLSYGDCKALSNYTKSLLEAAGLKALCALIEADDNGSSIENGFARNSFNHMIVCVPLKNDSIWLECTNPFIPSGYMGSFTDDRMALLLEGEDSHLTRTPSFKRNQNVINTKGTISLMPNGNARGNFVQNYSGSFFGELLRLKLLDEKDRKNELISQIKVPNFKLTSYTIQENKCKNPSLELNLNLDLSNYSTMMGSRIFFSINQFNPMSEVPRFIRSREFNLEIRRNRAENDTVFFQLPDGFQLEALPNPVEITTDFGSFKCTSSLDKDRIKMVRHLEIYKGVNTPERYNEFREFLEKISVCDNSKCILIKSL